MPTLLGSCHCGANKVAFATERGPEEIEVRACQCHFCRVHNALSISDPQGQLTYVVSGTVTRYRFGLRLADFLLCSGCGAYLGAYMEDRSVSYGVLNLNVLDARDRFGPARPMTYDGETVEQRLQRRRERWTPARCVEGITGDALRT